MPRLPVISGLKCRKALEKIGYIRERQEGSHVIMVKAGNSPITVPVRAMRAMRARPAALRRCCRFIARAQTGPPFTPLTGAAASTAQKTVAI